LELENHKRMKRAAIALNYRLVQSMNKMES